MNISGQIFATVKAACVKYSMQLPTDAKDKSS